VSETMNVEFSTANAWGAQMEIVVCENCQWRYLMPEAARARMCPNCCRETLSVLPGGLVEMPHPYPPELVLPFELPESGLAPAVNEFCTGIPYPPDGLTAAHLTANLTRIFLPMWLVDADVSALWQAEAGFDYEVISHQEFYGQKRSGWVSKEVKEPRVRWESRVGRINRKYHNVAVPALEDAPRLKKQLGAFQHNHAVSYQPECLINVLVRLPDFPPKDAWAEAVPEFQKTGAQDCQSASGADHLRQFRWKAQFSHLNWTLMLLPIYATFYQDDDGQRLPVMIHGQTGQTIGLRRASVRRAGKTSARILAASILAVLVGLLLETLFHGMDSPLLAVSTIIILLGFLGCLGASIPYLIAAGFNRNQKTGQKGFIT
jgi:hypothetical protein